MIRGIWNRETVAMVWVAAALPLAVTWLLAEGGAGAIRLLFVLIVGGVCQAMFTVIRAQRPSLAGLVSALLIAMLAPQVGPLQFALGVAFGFVFGELVFGGWGRSVLSPAVVAIMFLGFAFPAAAWPHLPVQIEWAVFPAVVLLLAFGVLPWRALAGAVLVLVIAGGFALPPFGSAVAVVLVFILCDPAICATSPLGRWLAGALFGLLFALFGSVWQASTVQMTVCAALLVSLSIPLLDELAIAVWRLSGSFRHG